MRGLWVHGLSMFIVSAGWSDDGVSHLDGGGWMSESVALHVGALDP